MEFRIACDSGKQEVFYAEAPKLPRKGDIIERGGKVYVVLCRSFLARKLNKSKFDIFVIVKEGKFPQ